MKQKREWETKWECSADGDGHGCGNWHDSESGAERCCDGYIYELHVCSWCNCHIDYCKCDVSEDMES